MKKLALISLLPLMIFISGCANFGWSSTEEYGWSDYDYHNQMVDSILQPNIYTSRGNGHHGNYKTPRKYHVNTKDEERYHAINDRIQQRKHQVNTQKYSTHTGSSSTSHSNTHIPAAPANDSHNTSY